MQSMKQKVDRGCCGKCHNQKASSKPQKCPQQVAKAVVDTTLAAWGVAARSGAFRKPSTAACTPATV